MCLIFTIRCLLDFLPCLTSVPPVTSALSLVWSCDPVSRSGEGSWTDGGTETDLNTQQLEEATEPCPEASEDTDHTTVQARARTGQSMHN